LDQAARLAAEHHHRGAAPRRLWHSGKLRARQTGEAILRIAAPFAEFRMVRGLAPDDPPAVMAAALAGVADDLAVVGHMPNLDGLLRALAGNATPRFPLHGVVALETADDGVTWSEVWRWAPEG
jgi:phosphohistidine phosphatase